MASSLTPESRVHILHLEMWRTTQYPCYKEAKDSGGVYSASFSVLTALDLISLQTSKFKDLVEAALVAADCCGEKDSMRFVLRTDSEVIDIF